MKTETITSSGNPKFKVWQELLSSKGIRKNELCLLSGEKIVSEFLKNSPDKVSALLLQQGMVSTASVKVFELEKSLFKELDSLGTHKPLLVVKAPALPLFESEPPKGLEVVIPLSDPGNVGALIRSCVAFKASKIILTQEAANPYLPKSLRGAAGLSLIAPLYSGPKLEELLRMPPAHAVALDMKGIALNKFTWPKDVRLVVGEEGLGLPASANDIQRVSISMSRDVESLNAVVATSLALHSYYSYLG